MSRICLSRACKFSKIRELICRVKSVKIGRNRPKLATESLGLGCEASTYDFLCVVDDFSVLAVLPGRVNLGEYNAGLSSNQALHVGFAME